MVTSLFKCLLSFSRAFTRCNFRSGILLLAGLKAALFKSLRHLLHMKTQKAVRQSLPKSSSFITDCIRKVDFLQVKIGKTIYPKKDKQEDLLCKKLDLTNLKDWPSPADSCRYSKINLKELKCILEE